MDLGNQQLSKAARTANETAHAHAKQLRTTKATTGEAIAKMQAMRQHAHTFAEGMLDHIAAGLDMGVGPGDAPSHQKMPPNGQGVPTHDAHSHEG